MCVWQSWTRVWLFFFALNVFNLYSCWSRQSVASLILTSPLPLPLPQPSTSPLYIWLPTIYKRQNNWAPTANSSRTPCCRLLLLLLLPLPLLLLLMLLFAHLEEALKSIEAAGQRYKYPEDRIDQVMHIDILHKRIETIVRN